MRVAPPPHAEPQGEAGSLQTCGAQPAFVTTKRQARAQCAEMTRARAGRVEGELPDLAFRKRRASPAGRCFLARIGRGERAAEALCARLRAAGRIRSVFRNRG